MSYVPPHMRNNQTMNVKNPFQRAQRPQRRQYVKPRWEIEEDEKKAGIAEMQRQAERGLERTEENFPTLGNGATKQVNWDGRKFNELASEWKEQTEREKEVVHEEKPEVTFSLPRFHNIRRFAEPEEIFEPRPIQKYVDPDGEWNTVTRKPRKEKRDLTFEELEAKYGGEVDEDDDTTVWGGTEEHQTCWDQRT